MARSTSSKGGYDCDFVTPPRKELECTICLLTVRQPMVVSCCGNQFCQRCIGRVQQDNKPCPLCNDVNFTTFLHKGVMREVNSLRVRCPQRELGCHWEGELGQLDAEHLNPGDSSSTKGCGYVLVECRHKCGEMRQRNEMQKHELEDCLKRPLDVQVFSLAKSLKDLSTNLHSVIAENETLKVENEKRKGETKQLKDENEKLKREIAAVKSSVHEAKSTCTALQSSVMPVPPFNFTMLNVTLSMKSDYTWSSPPFYSHNGGYKMDVDVSPNGNGTGKGTHLSLYIAIMRGEYDHQLRWPFAGKVFVEMYNFKSDQWCDVYTGDFSEAPHCSQRRPPLDNISNQGWGHQTLLPHAELKQSYLKSDIIRFRISRVVC